MSINLLVVPQDVMPVYNEVMLVISSSKSGSPQFTYLIDIKVDGNVVSQIRAYNDPNNKGVIDLHRHLESLVTFDLDHTSTVIGRPVPKAFVKYDVDIYEEYFEVKEIISVSDNGGKLNLTYGTNVLEIGDEVTLGVFINSTATERSFINTTVTDKPNPSFVTVDLDYTTYQPYFTNGNFTLQRTNGATTRYLSTSVDNKIAFNGVLPWLDVPNYDMEKYNMGPTYGCFLTTIPKTSDVRRDDRIFLDWWNEGNLDSSRVLVETNRGKFRLEHGLSPTTDDNKISQIGVGPWNLINTTTTVEENSNSSQLGLPMFDDNTTEYTVSLGGAPAGGTFQGIGPIYDPVILSDNGSGTSNTLQVTAPDNVTFQVGDQVIIAGSNDNNGIFTILSISTSSPFKIIQLNFGYNNSTGPTDAGSIQEYGQVSGISSPASEVLTFKIDDTCYKFDNYKLMYLDPLGSFQTVNFELSHKKNVKVKRTNYRQNYGSFDVSSNSWGYNSYDRGLTRLDTDITDTFEVTTDWVNEDKGQQVIELMQSPEVYHLRDDGTLIAIDIITTSQEQKQKVRDKLFNYTLTFKYSHKNTVQRG